MVLLSASVKRVGVSCMQDFSLVKFTLKCKKKVHFSKVTFLNKTRNLLPNKTRNLPLLPRWTVSARQGPVLGPAQSILTGPESLSDLALDCLCHTGFTPCSFSLPFLRTFCYSCFSVKLCFLDLLGPRVYHVGKTPFVCYIYRF